MERTEKELMGSLIEDIIPMLREHGNLFYNDGWDELVETYSDDDIYNTLYLKGISNLDDAIIFFHDRFNPQ